MAHFCSFLTGIIEMCRIRGEQKNITFVANLDEQLPVAICADEKRLRQILINLIGNAIKFTDSGNVSFNVKVLKLFENQQYFNKIRFEIIDTGVGMSTEQIEKIFLPFEQVVPKLVRSPGTLFKYLRSDFSGLCLPCVAHGPALVKFSYKP